MREFCIYKGLSRRKMFLVTKQLGLSPETLSFICIKEQGQVNDTHTPRNDIFLPKHISLFKLYREYLIYTRSSRRGHLSILSQVTQKKNTHLLHFLQFGEVWVKACEFLGQLQHSDSEEEDINKDDEANWAIKTPDEAIFQGEPAAS